MMFYIFVLWCHNLRVWDKKQPLYTINRYTVVGVTTASYFELVLFTSGYDTYTPMIQMAVCGGVGVHLLLIRVRVREDGACIACL